MIYFLIILQVDTTFIHEPFYKTYYIDGDQLLETILGLSFEVTNSHYKIHQMYLKCADRLESSYLHSDEQVIKFIRRPPTESIMMNTGQLANKAQGQGK